jgi:putative nucleotidyltransferase with HDIG domain
VGLLGYGVLVGLVVGRHGGWPVSLVWGAGFFLGLAVVVGMQPVRLPGGAMATVGFAVDYATLLIFGPAVAALVGVASCLVLLWRSQPLRQLFNQGVVVLSFAGAGWAYEALGGRYVEGGGPVVFWRLGPALAASAGAFVVIPSLLISGAMALWQRRSLWGIWGMSFRWVMARALALTPFGLLMAMVYQIEELGIVAVLLFVVPLVGARYAFQGAMEMVAVHRETVLALSNALEAYDPYTRDHSEQVTRYALQLGRELGLSASRLEALEWACRLHDIGKCHQDWEPIIRKPGRPSAQEWEVIRQHPVEGSRMAEKMEFLPHTAGVVARIVRAHHEWVDGKGYPDGLSGEQIPLEARILGVADAFEAMTAARSWRTYRPSRTLAEAVEEVKRYSGRQFDPQVAAALVRLWERGELARRPAAQPERPDREPVVSELAAPQRAEVKEGVRA